MFLAAGFGTRLEKEGINKPKGLFEIGGSGKTLVGNLYEQMGPLFKDVYLITNGKFEKDYREWTEKTGISDKVVVFSNGIQNAEKRNGALKDLWLSIDHFNLKDGNLFVFPSDTYIKFSINEFMQFCGEQEDSFVTIFQEKESEDDIKGRLGNARLETENGVFKVKEFIEKPDKPISKYASVPIYRFTPRDLDLLDRYIKEGNNPDAPGNFLSWLIQEGREIAAFVTRDTTIDVGTPGDIKKLEGY